MAGLTNVTKKKENKTDPDKRSAILTKHKEGVLAMYTATLKAREEIVSMMNGSVIKLKDNIMLDE